MKILITALFLSVSCLHFCSPLNAGDEFEAAMLRRMKRFESKLQRLDAENDVKNEKIKSLQLTISSLKNQFMTSLKDTVEEKCNNDHLDSILQRLADLEKLCPVGDPRYKLILDKCYYFEVRPMNYPDAKSNCQDKFRGGIGQLFEPRQVSETENVFNEAKNSFNFGGIWIGVEHEDANSSFVLATSQQSVQITAWNEGQPDLLEAGNVPGLNCVLMGFQTTSSWNIAMCGSLYNSICEQSFAIHQGLPADYEPLDEQDYYDDEY